MRRWSCSLGCALVFAASTVMTAETPGSDLPAPIQISPADKTRLHGTPRRISFEWSKVNHANGYGIEIDYFAARWASEAKWPHYVDWVKDANLTYDFVGDQPGAWRVWAMDKKGRPGKVSPWSLFTFGADSSTLPDPPAVSLPEFSRLPPAARAPLPLGKLRDLPLLDPITGEACVWPPAPVTGAKPPRPIYTPEPEFTDAARKAKAQGTVTLSLSIGEDGLVKRVCVAMASRDDLGLSAAKTVRMWRFEPAQKDGKPIAYNLSTEVDFHLY